MLADTIVRRWQDHQPLNRLEGIYAREGLQLEVDAVRMHEKIADLVRPVVKAMRADALAQP
jgi:transcription termination factor Rho